MVALPLVAVTALLPALWRDTLWRRRALVALAVCLALAVLSFVAVTRGSGPWTPIWGLIFLGTPWWAALSLLTLRIVRACGARRR